jgi:hypothetical protein
MAAMTLPVGSIITIAGSSLSEHNRQPVQLSNNRIESSQRMANGTLRKFFVADKESISVSWGMLPSFNTFTVDGGWGARDLKNFYESAQGRTSFTVTIKYGETTITKSMMFSSATFEIARRNVREKLDSTPQEFWNVSISLEEV